MTEPFNTSFEFARGYWPNQSITGADRVPNTLIGGKNCWVEGPGVLRSWGGATALMPTYGNNVMGLLGTKIYTLTTGSAALYRGGAIFFIGSGNLNVGTDTTSVNVGPATSTLMISLDGSAGSARSVGLSPPPACTASQGTTASTTPTVGTYSFKTTFVRTDDNAESNGSPVSNTFTTDGTHKVLLTFFSGSGNILPFGNVARRIYVSKRGFPDGPWFFLAQISPTLANMEFAWLDGELGKTNPPIDYDPPPTGTHCFALGKYVFVAGVGGVGGVHCSASARPEGFPPDFISFLNPNEIPLGIRGRPAAGWQYIFCRNSLHSVYLTGDEVEPFQTRAIWSETGIANERAAAFVGGEFYGYNGKKGAIRTSAGTDTAEPDSKFALAVETDMDAWDPSKVVVGWDQQADAVFYFHKNTALAYMRKQEVWSLPFVLADAGIMGDVTGAVTYQGRLIFSVGTAMYEMTGSSSSIPWVALPNWSDGSSRGWYKTITSFTTAFNVGTKSITTDLLINFDTANVKSTNSTMRAASSSVDSTGVTGLNDLSISGTFTGTQVTTYTIKISNALSSPDKYQVKKNTGAFGSDVSMMASTAQLVGDGISVVFAAQEGHTLDDQWVITLTPASATMGSASGAVFNNWKKCNVKHAYVFTIRYMGTGANQFIYGSEAIGGLTRMRVR